VRKSCRRFRSSCSATQCWTRSKTPP
jgi:hypothetical protein